MPERAPLTGQKVELSSFRRVARVMASRSILYSNSRNDRVPERRDEPEFFRDLNLDKVVNVLAASPARTDLAPYFYTPLKNLSDVTYRQSVMRDLENRHLRAAVAPFSDRLWDSEQHLAQLERLNNKYEKAIRFLSAVDLYSQAVSEFSGVLSQTELASDGLFAIRDYLDAYTKADAFTRLKADAERVASNLSAITYNLVIDDSAITVSKYEGEADYTPIIEQTFEKFRRGATRDHLATLPRWDHVTHIQEQVLNRLALLYPEAFGALEAFHLEQQAFRDETILRFNQEIRFYVSYLDYIEPLKKAGVLFCYPEVSESSKQVRAREAFDLPLAHQLDREGGHVVPNDFSLSDSERIFVISGPNQGGKTTFARMFGQLHYLASLGCPVPGASAKLFLLDQIFTHFEREEDIQNLRGKLQDDLVRIRHTLDHATANSIIIMNEIFSSTALKDSIFLGKKIMARISELDLLAICVTFVEELASFDEKTVSMVSTVDPANPDTRTFKVERIPANGLAYALAIAERHRVTYACLKERIHR